MTPAAGASVPITNALPLTAFGEAGVVVVVLTPEQPMTNIAMSAIDTKGNSNLLP
jgi:hypothetical protein